jgi:hypothetical protein
MAAQHYGEQGTMFLPNIGPTYHNTWFITQKNVIFAETMEFALP